MIKTRMLNNLNQSLNNLKWLAYFNQALYSNSNMLIDKTSADLLYKLYRQNTVSMHWVSFGASQPPRAKVLHKLGLIYMSHVLNHYTWRLTPLGKQYAEYLFKGLIPAQSSQTDDASYDRSSATPTGTISEPQELSTNQKICLIASTIGTIGTMIATDIEILNSSLVMSVISGLLTILFVIIMCISSHRPRITKTIYGSPHHSQRASYQQVRAIDFDEANNNASQGQNGTNQFTFHMPGGDINAGFSSTSIYINGHNVFSNTSDAPIGSDGSMSDDPFNHIWNDLNDQRMPITKKDLIRFLIIFNVYSEYPKDAMNYLTTAIDKVLFPDQSQHQYNDEAHMMFGTIDHRMDDAMNMLNHEMNNMFNGMFGNQGTTSQSDSDSDFFGGF